MSTYQKMVLKLLLNIWDAVRQSPGVATYAEDEEFYKSVELAIK